MIESAMELLVKRVIPKRLHQATKQLWRKSKRNRAKSLPPLSEQRFEKILTDDLGLNRGDVVMVHASLENLHLSFPPLQILGMLRSIVGNEGTMLFPTYPKNKCVRVLSEGQIFDVRRSPSYSGILGEFARRQKGAVRSIHPTKSVVAIGPVARSLTATHQGSPYPYDACSPYYKLIECNGKVIGLGAETRYLANIHCVDDALKEEYPVFPYHSTLFHARCVDYEGQTLIVDSYAHDVDKLDGTAVMAFFRKHIPNALCEDRKLEGMRFFRADAAPLFARMVELAQQGYTTFPHRAYKK